MSTRTVPMRAVPGYFSSTDGIHIAIQTGADASDEDLQFFQQLGVEWAMVGINHPHQHTLEFYKALVKRFDAYGSLAVMPKSKSSKPSFATSVQRVSSTTPTRTWATASGRRGTCLVVAA